MTHLVLLAEEDLVMRDQLARALRAEGYQVIAVRDGLGLCDYLECARFSNGRVPDPDVIVADAELEGYGGAQICQQLSSEGPGIPFILLGLTFGPLCSGAAQVLAQPVACQVLLDAVAGCLNAAISRPAVEAGFGASP